MNPEQRNMPGIIAALRAISRPITSDDVAEMIRKMQEYEVRK